MKTMWLQDQPRVFEAMDMDHSKRTEQKTRQNHTQSVTHTPFPELHPGTRTSKQGRNRIVGLFMGYSAGRVDHIVRTGCLGRAIVQADEIVGNNLPQQRKIGSGHPGNLNHQLEVTGSRRQTRKNCAPNLFNFIFPTCHFKLIGVT